MNNIEYLNEVYIGREPINPLFKQFSVIRNKLKNKPYSSSMNLDKDVLKFNRLVENFFGYKSYALNFNMNNTVNAYTFSVYDFLKKDEAIKRIQSLQAGQHGFRYNPKEDGVSAISTINMGLFGNGLFSNEEVFAILLHEIGHTFFEAVSGKHSSLYDSLQIIQVLKSINKRIIERISSGEEITFNDIKFDTNTLVPKHLHGVLNKLAIDRIMSYPMSITNNLVSIAKTGGAKIFGESMQQNTRLSRKGYTNEKFADSFATMYGYGPYLHSALLKMDSYIAKELNIKQPTNTVIVLFSASMLLLVTLTEYLQGCMDPHPKKLGRAKASIDQLKREVAKESLDPKVKIEIVAQIDELNKLIDDYENFPKSEDNIAIYRAYYVALYKLFGGDPRELDTDTDALFDAIDKRYQDLSDN